MTISGLRDALAVVFYNLAKVFDWLGQVCEEKPQSDHNNGHKEAA